ncbi:hypothetical protein [Aquimarina algiphila]|uniref:Uncharacterized protein n=2 Tax=Aquimarina algiphila TaxID=2047982 RepID=A0A554VIF9_9FLAO|nr:hypothetical protein [Aquimarina algiphila]TSE07459.1 hypothetical protein FOF46_15535 [Aquimarina algiphila]
MKSTKIKRTVNLLTLVLAMILSQACNTDDKEIPVEDSSLLLLNEKMLNFENIHSYTDFF